MIFYVIVPDDNSIKTRKFVLDDYEKWFVVLEYVYRLMKEGHSVHVEKDFTFPDDM